MRPKTISLTGTGNGTPYPVDWAANQFQLSLGCSVNGTVNYTIQHTFDDILNPNFNLASAVWFNHATLNALAVNADGNYSFPITGLRIVNNSGTGTTTVRLVSNAGSD